MPRHNHSSDEARKRIARELERLEAELDKVERELHAAWLEWQYAMPDCELGEERPEA